MDEKNYERVIYQKKDSVAKITLNNPKSLNSMDKTMLLELNEVLLDAEKDQDIKAITITGAGDKAFSVGGDFNMFLRIDGAVGFYEFLRDTCYHVFRLIDRIEKPVIAVANGYTLAGGFELALACDFIISSDKAIFGVTESNLGLIPGAGGVVRLLRAMPLRKAKELVYTSSIITAKEAEALGVVNKVVPQNKLENYVQEVLNKIIDKPMITLRLAKVSMTWGLETANQETALALERISSSFLGGMEFVKEKCRSFLASRSSGEKGKSRKNA